jgi:2'-5' RNA ligase
VTTACGRGISLWLMPEGAARDGLAAAVARLAARLGTEPFAPHLTLLPGIDGPEDEVLETTGRLASILRPLRLSLRSIEGRDEPFRCLFAVADPDEPLRAAHAAAARAFGREPDPAFVPHLSLVYGTLAPEVKRSLVVELTDETPLAFESARIHAWRTEGPVRDWRALGAFRLGGGR